MATEPDEGHRRARVHIGTSGRNYKHCIYDQAGHAPNDASRLKEMIEN